MFKILTVSSIIALTLSQSATPSWIGKWGVQEASCTASHKGATVIITQNGSELKMEDSDKNSWDLDWTASEIYPRQRCDSGVCLQGYLYESDNTDMAGLIWTYGEAKTQKCSVTLARISGDSFLGF